MMEPIRRLLKASSLKRQETSRCVASAMIVETADAILTVVLPAAMAGEAKSVSFRDGVLKIGCSHSAASQEVRLRQDEIMSRLNTRFGDGTVRRLTVR